MIASAAEREGGRRLPRPPISFYRWLRPLLFTIDPESAHHLTLRALRVIGPRSSILGRVSGVARVAENRPGAQGAENSPHALAAADSPLARTVAGIRFPNPVGLAAGYDKDAVALPALAALGFGFIEIG